MPGQDPPIIAAVPTSISCFVGRTMNGPVLDPQLCRNVNDFENTFGSDNQVSDTAMAVSLFFLNGGTVCWVTQIVSREGPSVISDYVDAFAAIDRKVDLFNLMVLPKENGILVAPPRRFYNIASFYCQKKNAFLIMDPPAEWITNVEAIDTGTGINNVRNGLVREQCAVYFPNLVITGNDGSKIVIGPAGAVAGVMSRIDASLAVWKAPAGGDADVRGITGLTFQISDMENGPINTSGINAIRTFQDRIVCWGARTVDGDDSFASDWKFIPVRRTGLFIEESLTRGLQWIKSKPNDESLWSGIRLSAGNFMRDLFQEGAFEGAKPGDAFFVKCDDETTTQNDINNGIVNILVGFAPLKPAEFILLSLKLLV